MKNYIDNGNDVIMHAYNRFPIVFEKGEGKYLYDTEGKKYLDFAAGIAVMAFGYADKEYSDTLKEQVDKLLHTSNLFYNVPAVEAAKKMVEASGLSKVFFTNSGTEAIEGAIKLARKYYYMKNKTNDSEIIAMNHSFHGRSLGSLAVTGQPKYQEAFKPLMGGVKFADFNDLESVKALVNEKTSAILCETIQGEGGLYPGTVEFITGLRKICDENDIVLILDEIQCGMGRTGKMFAYQNYGIMPDIITSAKALGCGVPVGAFIANEKLSAAMEPGDHGTTYGGNPFVCAAVSKVFDIFKERDILANVCEVSKYLEEKLEELKEKHSCIIDRRGMGFMQGIEFDKPVGGIVKSALENGLVIISAGANIIRFVPPLIIDKSDVDEMIKILDKCISE